MKFLIKTNKENEEYLDIRRSDIAVLQVLEGDIIPEDIKKAVNDIFFKIIDFEKQEKQGFISKISIRKDSKLGKYLLNTSDIDVINDDEVITYKKVVNAFNIAVYTENLIYEQIHKLFKSRDVGSYNELVKKYDSIVLEYILKNPDFKMHLEIEDGNYITSEYIVYENGKFDKRKLSLFLNKTKIRESKKYQLSEK